MRLAQWASAAAVAALAGCTSVQDPFLTGATAVSGPSVSSTVPAEFATASLPLEAGRVVGVRQDVRSDGLTQSVLYENATSLPGENRLSVDFGAPGATSRYLRAPTTATVRAEMRAALPGIRMQISGVPGNNAQGVFGYAIGASGRGGCVYAWQLAKGGMGEGYAAQVRLRFCHPTLSADRLVALMSGLRLRPVTKQTLDTLRFAAGAARPVATLEETHQSAYAGEVREEQARQSPRRTSFRPSAAEADWAADGVAVPLPDATSEATATDTSVTERREAASAEAAVAVPLPQ